MLSKTLDQLTDRLTIWQALGTLGVEETLNPGAGEQQQQKARSVAAGNGIKEKGKGRVVVEDERSWVCRFCEDTVER
jgi:hypothetical protein